MRSLLVPGNFWTAGRCLTFGSPEAFLRQQCELLVMTYVVIEMKCASRNREKVLELLRFSADRLGTKPGCLGAGVYEGCEGKETILYMERWETKEEFHRHIKSDLYFGVLTAIDLAQAQPEINFYEVSSAASMDLVAKLRGREI
jgi:quinol monooxygenase YgiN